MFWENRFLVNFGCKLCNLDGLEPCTIFFYQFGALHKFNNSEDEGYLRVFTEKGP